MRALVERFRSRLSMSLASAALMASAVAGCSSDISRFSDNPLANPYAASPQRSEVTGSVPAAQPAQSARVEARPLPAPQGGGSLPPPHAAAVHQPTAGGDYGSATWNSPPPRREVTGSLPPAPQTARGDWNWDGGTAVTVERGETVDSMSRRYGVPASAILQANSLTSAAALQPGQRIVIPRYNRTAAPNVSAPATRLASTAPSAGLQSTPASTVGGVHVVQPGETLMSLGRRYGKSRREIARANRLPEDYHLRIGQQIVVPGLRTAAPKAVPAQSAGAPPVKPAATPARAAVPAGPAAAPPARTPHPAASQKVAHLEPAATARVATQAPSEEPEAAEPMGTPSFRWPVRGRVIAGFGPKPNGQHNDGINLAVPEGTSVKASEDGVVAYAGSELKGYGNLVLVRHGNGYVTAYAHASELLVKRGDRVKRGQIIARAGQTGSVNSPQLHFEIRKGKKPVDPIQYLSGG